MSSIKYPTLVNMKVHCGICGEWHKVHSGILGAFYLCECRVIKVKEGDEIEYQKVENCG